MQTPPENAHDAPQQITLPEAYIRGLKAKLDAKKRLLESLPQEISQDEEKYKAALHFAPLGFNPELPPKVESVAQQEERSLSVVEARPVARPAKVAQLRDTWVAGVIRALDGAGRGLSHKDLLGKVLAASPTLKRGDGDKSFYNAIAKATERGDLTKHGGLLYSTKLVRSLEARGEHLPLETEAQPRVGSSGHLILDLLKDFPEGATAPELKKMVQTMPHAPKSLRDHGQYIYNILATLMGAGAVVKKEGVYRLSDDQQAGVAK